MYTKFIFGGRNTSRNQDIKISRNITILYIVYMEIFFLGN